MQVKQASGFTVAELTNFWNLGYTGYFMPITFTDAIMERWMQQGAFDLENSLVWFEGEAMVGFSFLGVRDGRGWIGGFGVAPDFRGKGLSYELFAQHAERMRSLGLAHVQLEVLSQNWARKVYERVGFATTRVLAVMTGELPRDAAQPAERPTAVGTASGEELLAHHARLHAASPSCWQREPGYLLAVPPTAPRHGLYVGPLAAPTGYLVYTGNAERTVLLDGAAESEADATALLQALAAERPGAMLTVLNEPLGTPLHRALVAAGLAERSTQFEMHWQP